MPPETDPPKESKPLLPRRPKRGKKKSARGASRRGLTGFFLRGLITLAPVLLTLIAFGLAFQMVNRYVTGPINKAIYWSLEGNDLGWRALRRMGIDPFDQKYLDTTNLPVQVQDEARRGFSSESFKHALEIYRAQHDSFFKDLGDLAIQRDRLRADVQTVVHPLIGVLISLLLVLWLGWLVGGFVGRKIVSRLDQAMHVIPVVKSVYPYSKQLVEFFFADKQLEFDTVVALPYPSRGLWSIGFVTGSGLSTLREETGERLVSVFVPSSPMPMTGYTIFVPFENLIPMTISVDEALRITMTGGVIVPPSELVDDPLVDEAEGGAEPARPPAPRLGEGPSDPGSREEGRAV